MSDFTTMNITGGFPSHGDLAPSIIFLGLYIAATCVLLYRLTRRTDRSKVLAYPAVFIITRVAMLVIRCILSKAKRFSEGLFIAESILVLVGPVFLLHPLVAIFSLHMQPHVGKEDQQHWINRVAKLLHVALLGAVITGIIAGSTLSSALDDPSKMSTVIKLRKVSCILALVISVVLVAAVGYGRTQIALSHFGTLYIGIISLLMIIIGVYRILNTFSTSPDATIRSKACFWILQVTFELLALACYLAVSIPTWFPGYSYEASESVAMPLKHSDSSSQADQV